MQNTLTAVAGLSLGAFIVTALALFWALRGNKALRRTEELTRTIYARLNAEGSARAADQREFREWANALTSSLEGMEKKLLDKSGDILNSVHIQGGLAFEDAERLELMLEAQARVLGDILGDLDLLLAGGFDPDDDDPDDEEDYTQGEVIDFASAINAAGQRIKEALDNMAGRAA